MLNTLFASGLIDTKEHDTKHSDHYFAKQTCFIDWTTYISCVYQYEWKFSAIATLKEAHQPNSTTVAYFLPQPCRTAHSTTGTGEAVDTMRQAKEQIGKTSHTHLSDRIGIQSDRFRYIDGRGSEDGVWNRREGRGGSMDV
mmetsp:Transcript_760/g.1605  ORF Transcript_760/g.1605 Transcript_760/m.1605 type:complete len:141 (-) Transcript_760:116-538(-)